MEYTKELLQNTCILCNSEMQGQRIITFYESFGFKNDENLKGNSTGYYYVVNSSQIKCIAVNLNYKLIKLPSIPRKKKLTFPREMMVSNEEIHWFKRLVVGKVEHETPYITLASSEFSFGMFIPWKFAKEIE